jgi:uncharacterized protein (DUF1778 family)
MATSAVLEKRSEKLDVRVSPTAKSKLQAAAMASHRTVSDFVLDSALSRAEETLADRRIFPLEDDKWEMFLAALDAPPRQMPRMRALLQDYGYSGLDIHSEHHDSAAEEAWIESREGFERAGFTGFSTVLQLRASNCAEVPDKAGVYLVLKPEPAEPHEFLSRNPGGHYRGDPTVSESLLREKWVDNASLLYVGMAKSLRSRWQLRLQFIEGRKVRARGGRYLWQLKDHAKLIVCWKATGNLSPRLVEGESQEIAFCQFGSITLAKSGDVFAR